jgi:hypothetical protein
VDKAPLENRALLVLLALRANKDYKGPMAQLAHKALLET